MFYNGIKLPELPQTCNLHQPRIPYCMIMPDGSVEDVSDLSAYAAEDKCSSTS